MIETNILIGEWGELHFSVINIENVVIKKINPVFLNTGFFGYPPIADLPYMAFEKFRW